MEITDSIRSTTDTAFFKGRRYSDKAPGMALASLPGFSTAWFSLRAAGVDVDKRLLYASWVGCATSAALFVSIGATMLWLMLAHFVGNRRAFLTVAAVVLGAATFPYATMMHAHSLVIGLLIISLCIVCRKPEAGGNFLEMIGGYCAGWALASEYSAGLVVTGICIYLFSTSGWNRTVLFLTGMIFPLLMIPLYSWITIETPFKLPYSYQSSFVEMRKGIYGIQWPNPETAFHLVFGSARGLFFWSPFLAMAIAGFPALKRQSPKLFWLTYAVPILHITVISGRTWDWPAGFTLCPRLLSPIIPLLAIPCAFGLRRFPRLGIISAIYSIAIITLATLTNACPQFNNLTNPLFQYHLPLFIRFDINPTLGALAGLPSSLSVAMFYAVLVGGGWWIWKRFPAEVGPIYSKKQEGMKNG